MRRERVKPRTVALLMLVIFVLSAWLYNMHDDNRSLESNIELYQIALCNKDTTIMTLVKQIDSIKKSQIKPEVIYTHTEKKSKKPITPIDTTKIPTLDSVVVPIDTMKSE